jgi:circadian clock protein KaiC
MAKPPPTGIRIPRAPAPVRKARTGIEGFDEITFGGLPHGRPTLICGTAGSGKTLFGIEFLLRGAVEFNEPGVVITFEEMPHELARNVASLGMDLDALTQEKKLVVDYVHIERSEIEEAGEYDLEGLFLRLGAAIDSIGAKRVLIDTLDALFAALSDQFVVRSELRRLFRWLKDRGVTAVITAERGDGALTRHGLEEYVSDCVILLDNRVIERVGTRRLRVVKYRGSAHGSDEYPFLIGTGGFSVLPLSSVALDHEAPKKRISSGIAGIDEMLEGKGFYKGSTILVSGTAGTGKSSIAAHFANGVCKGGGKCLYLAFEEGPKQILRNMASIGMDLGQWVDRKRLVFNATRPTQLGLELHFALLHKQVNELRPDAVIIDPISNFAMIGDYMQVKAMLMRMVDFLKSRQVTCLITSLTEGGEALERTEAGISSLVDTWLLLRDTEHEGERTGRLYVLKSRGMAHSKRVREFQITHQGIKVADAGDEVIGAEAGASRVAKNEVERVTTAMSRRTPTSRSSMASGKRG